MQMNDNGQLNDDQVQDRLRAALEALGIGDGQTVYGDTAMRSARRVLSALQVAVLSRQSEGVAMNDNNVKVLIDP